MPESSDSGSRKDAVSESFPHLSLRAKHVKGLRLVMYPKALSLSTRLPGFVRPERASPDFTVFRRDLRKFEI